MDLKAVLDFVDSGHDLILAADASASDLIRNIATEFGVDFDEVCEKSIEFYVVFFFFFGCNCEILLQFRDVNFSQL